MKRYKKTSQPLPWPLTVVFMLFLLTRIFEVVISLYWFVVVSVVAFALDLLLRRQKTTKQEGVTHIVENPMKKENSEYHFDPEDYRL